MNMKVLSPPPPLSLNQLVQPIVSSTRTLFCNFQFAQDTQKNEELQNLKTKLTGKILTIAYFTHVVNHTRISCHALLTIV